MLRKQPPRLASRRSNVTCSLLTENALFNFNDPLPQTLSLPSTILSYIVEKLKPKLIFKLTKTCKYMKFYCERRRGRVVDALYIGPRLHYDFTYCMAVQIDDKSSMFEKFINGLSIEKRLSCDWDTSFDTVSKILKLSKKCTVKDLYIENQILTCMEFEKLCKNVRSCLVGSLNFTDMNENGMLINILERIPNAIQIEIQSWGQGIYYTPTTASTLANLKQNAKIKHFELDSVPENFDPKDFGQFAKNNFATKCEANLHFQSRVSTILVQHFRKSVKPYIHDSRFRSKPPSLTVNRHRPNPFLFSDWQISMKQYLIYKFNKKFITESKKSKKNKMEVGGFAKY
uniref:F-box domain-containing protein n=1 Tax=Panagrolaimus superbus TaxID=310955 RepID=A0A914YW36_9BILA